MAKNKNDYFQLMSNQTEYCVKASELLAEMLSDFSKEKVEEYRDEIHKIEHMADTIHHDILTKLSTEFITPIDQEDILRLVQIVDDVTDSIDEVVLDFYMYDMTMLPKSADELSKLVNKCTKALYDAVCELKNFKKPEKLRSKLIELNTFEGQADEKYTEAIHYLFTNTADAKTLIGSKAIFESLENCCDLCEHASDVIEQIIIKNT